MQDAAMAAFHSDHQGDLSWPPHKVLQNKQQVKARMR